MPGLCASASRPRRSLSLLEVLSCAGEGDQGGHFMRQALVGADHQMSSRSQWRQDVLQHSLLKGSGQVGEGDVTAEDEVKVREVPLGTGLSADTGVTQKPLTKPAATEQFP